MKFVKPIIKQIQEKGRTIFKYLGSFPVGPPPLPEGCAVINVTK